MNPLQMTVDELTVENQQLRERVRELEARGFGMTTHSGCDAVAGSFRLTMLEPGRELCGLYFLCLGSEVVYVGKSVDVVSRVACHRAEGSKDFDSVAYLHAPPERLGMLERHWIASLQPKYNITGTSKHLAVAKMSASKRRERRQLHVGNSSHTP